MTWHAKEVIRSIYDNRKTDPLYRIRRLLTKADERLDHNGRSKLVGLLAAGDPKGEVKDTWHAKEVIRSIYEIDDPDLADAAPTVVVPVTAPAIRAVSATTRTRRNVRMAPTRRPSPQGRSKPQVTSWAPQARARLGS